MYSEHIYPHYPLIPFPFPPNRFSFYVSLLLSCLSVCPTHLMSFACMGMRWALTCTKATNLRDMTTASSLPFTVYSSQGGRWSLTRVSSVHSGLLKKFPLWSREQLLLGVQRRKCHSMSRRQNFPAALFLLCLSHSFSSSAVFPEPREWQV